MAVSENVVLSSWVAGTTFAESDLYKFVVADAQGHVILPNTTGDITPLGVLYGVTQTTSTEAEAVPIAVQGVVKVRMAASTLATGGLVASSTAGLGIAPTTDAYEIGIIKHGSSGAVNRIHSVLLTGQRQLGS